LADFIGDLSARHAAGAARPREAPAIARDIEKGMSRAVCYLGEENRSVKQIVEVKSISKIFWI
jgi:hypothetical protein